MLGSLKRALYGLSKLDVMNARGVIKLRLAIHLAEGRGGSGSPIKENVKRYNVNPRLILNIFLSILGLLQLLTS